MANESATYKGVTYENGKIPARFLVRLDGDNWGDEPAVLREDAAAAWNGARAEVLEKTGIELAVRGWNRSKAEQVEFYLRVHRKARPGEDYCCKWDGVPYVFTGSAHASPPGTSNHGLAIAVDIVDFGTVGQWNNPRYLAAWPILAAWGWTETEGRGSIQEPWHKVYDPAKNTRKNTTPPKEGALMALSNEEQDEVLEKIRDLHAGTAPKVDMPWTDDRTGKPEKYTLRSALKWIADKVKGR